MTGHIITASPHSFPAFSVGELTGAAPSRDAGPREAAAAAG